MNNICINIFFVSQIFDFLFFFSAVVASRSVIQRPTFESDAYLECRLTAPIFSEPGGEQMRERCELWMEGVRKYSMTFS